jgi:hypothetical protein
MAPDKVSDVGACKQVLDERRWDHKEKDTKKTAPTLRGCWGDRVGAELRRSGPAGRVW